MLFNAKLSYFSAISWREQDTFNEMMKTVLYQNNELNWIFIVASSSFQIMKRLEFKTFLGRYIQQLIIPSEIFLINVYYY